MLPGLIGFSAFLLFYVSVTALIAGQRDWHATFPAFCGLLLPGVDAGTAGPASLGRRVRPGADDPAAGRSCSCPRRCWPSTPRSGRTGGSWKRSVGAVVAWGLVAALVTAAGFVPLVRAGILDDFLGNLKTMSDSPYNSVGAGGAAARGSRRSTCR